MKTVPGYENSKPGIQVGTRLYSKITFGKGDTLVFDTENLAFLRQIGIEWLMVDEAPEHSVACYRHIVESLGEKGFKVYRIANRELHNMPAVTLNLPGRDRMVDRYLQYVSNLGEAGIRYATYAHMGNGIWRGNESHVVRGGAVANGLDLAKPKHNLAFGNFTDPLSHGRVYTQEELWENYEYFIRKVAPVAEAAKVYIGIHPDDPPVYPIAGVPRCIFGTFEGYKRAIEIADSPNIGVCFCVGCWLEGGKRCGCDPDTFIRYFAQRKKLFKVHMRNITAPLDQEGGFSETFPDDGYGNLERLVKTLDEFDFDGCVINDHLVKMTGGYYAAESYFTGYLKGLVNEVQNAK